MDTKRFFLYAIVIVALTLAGCGGNGGGMQTAMPDPDPTPPDPMVTCPDGSTAATMDDCPPTGPTPEEMALKDARDAAMDAYMAAMTAVDGAVDPVAMQNAHEYAAMAKEASDAAQAATTSAMAEEYQMQAETARNKAMEAAGEDSLGLTMLANKLLNGDDIENAELDGPPTVVPDPVYNTKNVDAAIAASADSAPANALTPVTVATDATTVIARGSSLTNLGGLSGGTQLVIGEVAGEDEPVVYKAGGSTFMLTDGTTTFQTGETSSRFQTRGGWEAQDLLLAADDGTTITKTHLVVSTDIQATEMRQNYTTTGDTVIDVTAAAVLNTAVITGDVPGDGTTFEGTYNADPEDNNSPMTGRFFCATPGSCSMSVNDRGVITAATGYAFQPIASGTTDVHDSDYLAWGMWVMGSNRDSLTGTTTNNTPESAQVGAFAYGNSPFVVPVTLEGKATYNGVAQGLYSSGDMVQYFEADATLEANFGGATGVEADGGLGRISGSISNLVAAGQAVDGSLNLARTDINANGTFGIGTDAGDTGRTDGVLGGNGFRGRWAGQLFGPAAPFGASNSVVATTFPTTAAGTFSAATQDDKMSLIGAFGSWKAE